MKSMLAISVTALLFATAAVKASPLLMTMGASSPPNLVDTAQYKKKGKGFKKKGAKSKGDGCWARCAAKSRMANGCDMRCAGKRK